MAEQIIESLAAEWEPKRYHDTYREPVLEFIEKKAAGEATAARREAEEAATRLEEAEAALA